MHVYANLLEFLIHIETYLSLACPAQPSMACNNILHKNIYFSLGIILHMLLFANILVADLRIQANTLLHELALLCILCEIEAFLSPYPCRFFFLFLICWCACCYSLCTKRNNFSFSAISRLSTATKGKGEAHSHRI